MKRPATAVDAREMRRRIKVRFGKTSDALPLPEHLVLFEVPAVDERTLEFPTGPYVKNVRRRIDAVAVGMWKRTEHLVHGFEIKVSRADLVAELRDPEKSAPGVAMCDRWWLALGSADLLRDTDVLPEGWGVIAASGRGLRVIAEPAARVGVRDGAAQAGILSASLRSHGPCRSVGYWQGVAVGRAAEKQEHEYRSAVQAWTERGGEVA